MANVKKLDAVVYLAPTAGRRFFTARGAAMAEAGAMVRAKYPSEKAEYENGYQTYPGYHWSQSDELVKLHARLARMILRRLKATA